jgi:hypothetical protein
MNFERVIFTLIFYWCRIYKGSTEDGKCKFAWGLQHFFLAMLKYSKAFFDDKKM